MDARSPNSDPKTVTLPAISSAASGAGPTPSNLLAGIQLEMFGPDPAPANHSPSPQAEPPRASLTSDISGPYGATLSPSAVLQLSLESRLRANLGVTGSLESELTWKHWAMPLGPPICALRVLTHRTAGKDFIGWPTPDTVAIGDGTDFEVQRQALLARRERTREAVKEGKTKAGSGRSMSLQMAAQSMFDLIAWPTPSASGSAGEISENLERRGEKLYNTETGRVLQTNLATEAKQIYLRDGQIVSWPTPQARDYKDRGENLDLAKRETKNQSLGVKARQVTDLWPTPVADGDRTTNYKQGGTSLGYAARSISETSGTDTTSPSAPKSTAQLGLGALNPELCRWLMGYPPEWDGLKDTETP